MQILELSKENIRNQIGCGENEQYEQRFCLQIDGMSIKEKETSDAVLNKVSKMWAKAAVNIPNDVVERSLWIGSSYSDKNTNAHCKSVL